MQTACFNSFIRDVNHFIEKETGANAHATYSRLLLYIKSFKLLTTEDILQLYKPAALVNFQLSELPLAGEKRDRILAALQTYLDRNNLTYSLDHEIANLEISGASEGQLIEIVRNYDVALQVTSSLSTRIRPGRFAQPVRSYGFEVFMPAADPPIVAIVDTGISASTPLAPLLIADEDLNLTGTPVSQDNPIVEGVMAPP
ncbi:hypothetical protein ACFOET_08905 [Parapedobacter deserti]|uniref:Peptidase A2 domain-containing protein n=1 Tax=Parapedobacter deserti TaxID=1912957 RepID=A0ABV7JLM0_9SPHI